MPMMPRMDNKATKIAYKILGVPANIDSKKSQEQKDVDRRLIAEETIRVR